MRILVTGAAGFLGSHLVDRLLIEGHEVLAVDNFFTGSRANLAHLSDNKNLEILRHDITFPLYVEVDQIYNLASPASPINYQRDPVQTLKTNVVGAANMLGLAKRLKARIFQASTSEVYGDPLQHPQTEEYWGNVNCIGERSCYDEGKRAAECLTMDYHREHDSEVRIVRIFNTYGPRMALDDGRVVSNFVAQAIRKEPLTIFGDGKQTRSFQYVGDLIRGMVAVMDNDDYIGPFNIGNPGEFTMLELAEIEREMVNPDVEISFVENTADDPSRRRPDITKAKTFLGWEPKVALRDGLKPMVEDFRKRLKLSEEFAQSKSAPNSSEKIAANVAALNGFSA